MRTWHLNVFLSVVLISQIRFFGRFFPASNGRWSLNKFRPLTKKKSLFNYLCYFFYVCHKCSSHMYMYNCTLLHSRYFSISNFQLYENSPPNTQFWAAQPIGRVDINSTNRKTHSAMHVNISVAEPGPEHGDRPGPAAGSAGGGAGGGSRSQHWHQVGTGWYRLPMDQLASSCKKADEIQKITLWKRRTFNIGDN